MQNQYPYKYKASFNSRNIFNKSNSYLNLVSNYSGIKIYKVRDNLFSSNSLSLLSPNKNKNIFSSNFNSFKSNYNYMIKNLINNDVDIDNSKKLKISSIDKIFNNENNLTKRNNFFIIENKNIIPLINNNYCSNNDDSKLSNSNNNIKNINNKKSIILKKTARKKENKKLILDKNLSPIPCAPFSSEKNKKENKLYSYRLINQILQFDKENTKKDNKIMSILSIKSDKNQNQNITKKIKSNYKSNLSPSNTHNIDGNFMIGNITKNLFNNYPKIKDKILDKKKLKEKKLKMEFEMEQERRDTVEETAFDLEVYKKNIKIFLTDEIRLNQIEEIKEEFFDILENKINFLYDSCRYPIIKNNLCNTKLEIMTQKDLEWNKINCIEYSTLTYLNKLKYKIQKELDDIDEGEKKEKEKRFRIYRYINKYEKNKNQKNKKDKKSNFTLSNDNELYLDNNEQSIDYIVKIMQNEIKNKKDDSSDESDKISDRENIYNFEEFFVHKERPYKIIGFANEKLSNAIYHNTDFYNLKDNTPFHIKKETKRESQFDIYL